MGMALSHFIPFFFPSVVCLSALLLDLFITVQPFQDLTKHSSTINHQYSFLLRIHVLKCWPSITTEEPVHHKYHLHHQGKDATMLDRHSCTHHRLHRYLSILVLSSLIFSTIHLM